MVAGARIEFFDAGTNTVRTMYADGELNTPLDPTNIVTDANGIFPGIYGQGGAYKAVVKLPGGSVLFTQDNIPGDAAANGGGGGGGGGDALPTGFVAASFLTGPVDGWVRANGRSIGSAASTATERANDDTELLFKAYWPNTLFPVSGGRGASADADWSANKTLTLPNAQLCALIGVDGMGATATGAFSALTAVSGNASTAGSKFGAATHTLIVGELPVHQHTGSTSTAGNHQHTGSTANAGTHTHSAVSDVQGNHSHTYISPTGTSLGGTAPSVVLAGTGSSVTSTDGAHSHNITVFSEGLHAHGFTTDAGGSHAHGFTTDATGSGTAHPNVQPSLLVTYYIKL